MGGTITQTRAHKRYRCRSCGAVLPAWLPVQQRPNGTLLLHHLSQNHRDQVRPYLDRMAASEDIVDTVSEAYAVEDDEITEDRRQWETGR
jgi:hypothetical protein